MSQHHRSPLSAAIPRAGLVLAAGLTILNCGCRHPASTNSDASANTLAARKPGTAGPGVRPGAVAAVVPPEPIVAPPGGVRAIYMTGWTAGSHKRFNNLVNMINTHNLNGVVIDVKDDGEVSYDMDVPLVKECHASSKMFDVDRVMGALRQHHIYAIARITCMRDNYLPKHHPEMAVHAPDGSVWHDRSRHTWLNPYNHAVWDYNVAVALNAIKHGFKEVQFDYVRFPSEGRVSSCVYPGKPAGALREDQIAAFMKYARDKIKSTGAYFAADVFGLTSLVKNDEGIGQKFQKVVQNVDYLCPMVYPSHYAFGEYGMKDPNREPYKLITLSVGDAVRRMKTIHTTCKLRPWIQDFSLRGVHYGPAQVAAQIKALNDLGLHEFLVWNAGNRYSASAFGSPASGGQTAASPGGAPTVEPTAAPAPVHATR